MKRNGILPAPYPSSADTCCADVNLIVKDTPPTYMGACLAIHWSAYGMLFVRKDIKQFSKHYGESIRTGIGVTTCTDSDCWHEYLRIACHSVCCILPVCRHPPPVRYGGWESRYSSSKSCSLCNRSENRNYNVVNWYCWHFPPHLPYNPIFHF